MKTIHHVVDIDASPTAVWRALTEPDQLAAWWSAVVDSPPASVGAQARWTFGGDFNPVMQTTDLTPERRLSWRCVTGHDNWQDNDFVFEFEPRQDTRTRLRFWQHYATELSNDDYGIYNFNWGYYLESLRLLCTTGTGTPYHPKP